MSSITVTVIAGPAAGASVTKEGPKKFCIGRIKTGNALVLGDENVSSKHAQFTFSDGTWFVEDLGSTNGTKQNDSEGLLLKGQAYPLRSGDRLQIGLQTVVQVQFQGACEDDDNMTVEEKLIADAERLAASIKAAAEASVQQIRRDWAEKRAALLQELMQS